MELQEIKFSESVGSKSVIADYTAKVTKWGIERGIINNPKGSNFVKQRNYLISEAGELAEGLNQNSKPLTIDAIGDYFVTINGTMQNKESLKHKPSLFVNLNYKDAEHYAKMSPEELFFKSLFESLKGNYVTAVSYLRLTCYALNLQHKTNEYNFENCLETAYNVISNRKTKLVDGVLISDKSKEVSKSKKNK